MTRQKETYNNLKQLQKVLITQNIPFVSYRLPQTKEIITLVQYASFPKEVDILNFNIEKSGFIISAFNESTDSRSYLLKPDCIIIGDNIEGTFIKKISGNNSFINIKKQKATDLATTTIDDFCGNVNSAKKAISNGQFQKVVLSKVRKIELESDFQPENFFLKLCEQYPNAMVYFLQMPEVGSWIGATPEPLLVIENNTAKTVSLASTQKATDKAVENYEWSAKEIEEQKIVTDFVEKIISEIGIENYKKTGPENYQAANLIHIKTSFEFPESNLENRFGVFLKTLHPTPSVGGLPKKEALNFILENEKHDRTYYSGFLGPLNINDSTNLFVNLRCLQLFDNECVLYSGAGITASSVAEKEWEETENKMLTMMNVMRTLKLKKK